MSSGQQSERMASGISQPSIGAPIAPAPAPVYGLGELDLVGLLTHPHLGVAVFAFFDDDTAAATALRATCSALRDAVAGHRWADTRTVVVRVDKWRRAFPAATAANVSRDPFTDAPSKLTDADFVHFRGLHTLNMSGCNQRTITDAAFAHLAGIHTLTMCMCNQRTITDAAFGHLAGIHTLNMTGCNQRTITDAAFAHLAGINTLNMRMCNQPTITDAALAHLAGIEELTVDEGHHFSQAAIEAFGDDVVQLEEEWDGYVPGVGQVQW